VCVCVCVCLCVCVCVECTAGGGRVGASVVRVIVLGDGGVVNVGASIVGGDGRASPRGTTWSWRVSRPLSHERG
jgi:hypothetical protein